MGALATLAYPTSRDAVLARLNLLSATYAWYDGVGNGTTDESTAVQSFVDANKGKTIFFPDAEKEYLFAGLLLSGSTYNGTRLVFEGTHRLLPASGVDVTNFGGAWVGIIFKDVVDCYLDYRGNGDRTQQADDEHTYLVGLAGVTNFVCPQFIGREVMGDGMYIGQSLWTSNTANTKGVHIGLFDVRNSAISGRNAMSIISGADITIGTFVSVNVGGTVGGYSMPGGFDIEPDHSYQICENINVGTMHVEHEGISGVALHGFGIGDACTTRNINIGLMTSICTSPAVVNDASSNPTQTNSYGLKIRSAANVNIKGTIKFTNAYGVGANLGDTYNSKIDLNIEHVRVGVLMGNSDEDVTDNDTGPVGCDLTFRVSEVARWGIQGMNCSDSVVRGIVTNPVSGMYATRAGVQFQSPVQANMVWSVSVPYHADWTRAYRQEGSTGGLTNCVQKDCSITGSWASALARTGEMQMRRENVTGVTNAAAMPNGGTWEIGTFVSHSDATQSGGKVLFGWYRLTSGSANVLDTDWSAVYGTTT
jgi:hypothetical protein